MKKLEVFDPAMCCSTGVCGVEVDPVLAQFSADLKWVAEQGIHVERHNLGQEPQAFAANPTVLKEIETGLDRLPISWRKNSISNSRLKTSRPLNRDLVVHPNLVVVNFRDLICHYPSSVRDMHFLPAKAALVKRHCRVRPV